MTAVDHAELKRLRDDLSKFEHHAVGTLKIKMDEVRNVIAACDAHAALLSEIEGLKAERERLMRASNKDNAIIKRLSERKARTQARDSWRPDRCDVEETIHAWLRDHAGNAIKMTMTPAIRDALADAILALRPQTAESGK